LPTIFTEFELIVPLPPRIDNTTAAFLRLPTPEFRAAVE
jgi:hypothetical protein